MKRFSGSHEELGKSWRPFLLSDMGGNYINGEMRWLIDGRGPMGLRGAAGRVSMISSFMLARRCLGRQWKSRPGEKIPERLFAAGPRLAAVRRAVWDVAEGFAHSTRAWTVDFLRF